MFETPPLPSWDGLHPVIVHFPVALLLVAPLFVLLALLVRIHRRGLLLAALVLMALGTASAWVAVETGEAAEKFAVRSPAVHAVLEHHSELAERTRAIFSVLTLVFAGLLFAPVLLRREPGETATVALALLFLAVYGAGALILANTAHNGGRLVHELGVHGRMPAEPLPAAPVDKD